MSWGLVVNRACMGFIRIVWGVYGFQERSYSIFSLCQGQAMQNPIPLDSSSLNVGLLCVGMRLCTYTSVPALGAIV